MTAEQLLRDGKLAEALAALTQQVRAQPADSKLRTFLFQLLVVEGQWQRALTQLSVAGEPAAMGYCHCASCREWSASPVNAFTLWSPSAVAVVRGEDQLASYAKTERSIRKSCKKCGGHVLTVHPKWALVDVFAGVIPDFPFRPQLHVNYGETVLHMHDGLPKQKDIPKEMGGSGQLLAE